VVDGLEVIAVGVNHEGGVIGGVVFDAEPGSAVIAAAGGKGGGVEGAHRGLVGGGEGDMDRAGGGAMGGDPEEGLAVGAVADALRFALVREAHDPADAERCQRSVVEGERALQIRNGYADVVEHDVA
jgi:hypothetical protein